MSAGTLFRGGVYNLVPNNNPIALPNGEWTIGIKLNIPFMGEAGFAQLSAVGYPNITEWGILLSVGWFNGSALLNEIKWYLNTYQGMLSTNASVKDTAGGGSSNLSSIPANKPLPKGNIWLFLRRGADGSWGEAYVEEGDTFTAFASSNAGSTLTAGIGGMTGSGGTAPTEWYIGNISDFAHNTARAYWLQQIVQEFFISNRHISDAEIQALATTSTTTTVATANGGQANLIRHYKFNNAPDTLVDLSNNNKNGTWVAPNYGAAIAPWYPTVSKLAIEDQNVTDPVYVNNYTRSFAAVSNTSGFTDTGLTIVSGAFQVRSNLLIGSVNNIRSVIRLSTIPQDTGYLRAEYLNLWNNDGDPAYTGIGLLTADGTSGYILESTSSGFALREVKSGVNTLSSVMNSQGPDANRTYAVELDDGLINFYVKNEGASVYVLRGKMVNTVSGQLYPAYISEVTTGGLGKGASVLTFKTAPAIGGTQGGGGGGGPTTVPGITFQIRDASTNGSPFVASGQTVTMTVYADGSPDVVEQFTGTTGANGSVTFTNNAWAAGQNKVCVLVVGGISQGNIPFQVIDITV